MTYTTDDLETRIRFRGGAGTAATWEWNVCKKGGIQPLRSGQTKGDKAKAEIAAQQALSDLVSSKK